jgi:predicted small secreted protein
MLAKFQKRKPRIYHCRTPFFLVLILFMLSACNAVRGSGNVITETRAVTDFNQVSLNGQGEIILTQGEQEALEIEAEDNIIAVLETEVRGDTLHIGTTNNTSIWPTEPVRFYLTMDEIAGLEVSGSGNIATENVMAGNLTLDVNGSGGINIDSLNAASLLVDINGSGAVNVAGQTTDQKVNISGSGKYQAADLESETVDAQVDGSGETTVWASETLSAEISGSGSVNYYGSPTVSQSIDGSGDLNSLGNR